MNLLGMLLDAQDSPAMKQLTSTFGVSEGEARNALTALVPALARGMQNNLAQQQGLENLLGALARGGHQRYIDQPGTIPAEQVTAEGNAILGHLLGSKDVSRRVAGHAAAQTGLDSGLLQRMLPVIATLVMGSVSKQSGARNLPEGVPGKAGNAGMGALLAQFLDADRDGSVLDDLLGMTGLFR
ncbi:MAG: DUF937 domain-containing protein [Gammaproteobacteria bacterium]